MEVSAELKTIVCSATIAGSKIKRAKMIRQIVKVPRECLVACSGGSDSMASLDFLRRSGKVVGVLHFNHKTTQSEKFEHVVADYCRLHNLPLTVNKLSNKFIKGSLEAFWSEKRNKFFNTFSEAVVTGHTLDDAVEWWIFTSLRGQSRLMPTSNKNVLRPFLTTRKDTLDRWNKKHDVKYVYDLSNEDESFSRNRIRHSLLPECLEINPGLHKTIAKKIMERQNALKDRRQSKTHI